MTWLISGANGSSGPLCAGDGAETFREAGNNEADVSISAAMAYG
tara:strand:+ start:246 stop:377 length:132 start_codon:yes stop_codon:yes gene_type:complete